MQEDFDTRMGISHNAQHLQYKKHPPFPLQDRYVLAPHTLSRREKTFVFRHLRGCPWCKGMQTRLRSRPNDWLEVWKSPDPRKL